MSIGKHIIGGLLCLILTTGFSQGNQIFPGCETEGFSCPDYSKMLHKIYDFLEDGNPLAAYGEFQLLEDCDDCPEHHEQIQDLGKFILENVSADYAKKNLDLQALLDEQKETNDNLRASFQALAQAEQETAQQLRENERMARTALATNYMRIAQEKFDQNDESGFDAALWLTDFTYAYIDSTHQDVQQMMYKLFHRRMIDNLPYTFYNEQLDDIGDFDAIDSEYITAMDWSGDSLWLAVGTSLNRVVIFSHLGDVVFNYSPDTGTEIFSLDWNRNNTMLAIASASQVVFAQQEKKEWHAVEERIYRDDFVRVVRWSPNESRRLALAGDESTVYVYNRSWEEPQRILPSAHNDWIRALSWSPDGNMLASGGDDGRVVLWKLNESNTSIINNQVIHSDYIRSLDWHPSGDTIVSGADDGVIIYQTADGTKIGSNTFREIIVKVAYSASGRQLGVFTLNNSFYLLENNLVLEDIGSSSNLLSFAWLGEGNTVTSKGKIENVRSEAGSFVLPVQLARIEQKTQELDLTTENIHSASWSPRGEILAYAQGNQLLVQQDDSLHRIRMENNEIIDLAWQPGSPTYLPNSNFFATVDTDSILAIWDAIDVEVEKNLLLSTRATTLIWSPDGRELFVGDDFGKLYHYDYNLDLIAEYQVSSDEDQINDLAWSPNGKYLAIVTNDRTAIIWDYYNRQEKTSLLGGHKDWLQAVVWLSDEELATCGDDQQLLIWQWNDTNQEYSVKQNLTNLSGSYLGLDYHHSSSLSTLAAGTYNGELGIWQRGGEPQDTFSFALDSLNYYASDFSTLNWHPNGRKLVYSSYAVVPEVINTLLKTEPAFDVSQVILFDRTQTKLSKIEYATLRRHFYLPEIELPNFNRHLLQWTSDERLMAFIDNNVLNIHDYELREQVHAVLLDRVPDFLTFSPNHAYLIVADKNELKLWPTNDWLSTSSVPLNMTSSDIKNWTWSTNSRYLAILDTEYNLLVYDLETREIKPCETQIGLADQSVNTSTLLFHPSDHNKIYIATTTRVYEYDHMQKEVAAQGIFNAGLNEGSIPDEDTPNPVLNWLNDGNQLLVQLPYEPLDVIELSGESIQQFGTPRSLAAPFRNLVYEYSFMNRAELPLSSAKRKYVKFWDPHSGLVKRKLLGIRNQLTRNLAVSESGNMLAGLGLPLTLSEGKYNIDEGKPMTLSIWELNQQIEVLSLPVPGAEYVTISPDGRHILIHFISGRVGVWPLDLSSIARFLNNTGKDRFLNPNNKKKVSFQSRIEEWGLERGLNIAPTVNMERLKQRESPQLRADWSVFFLDQAWLADDSKRAAVYFAKAMRLHLDEDENIRPSPIDSQAVANVFLDHTYFYLAQNEQQLARRFLSNAQKKLPTNALLEQAAILLSWQEGEQEAVFIQLNNQDNQLLDKAYEQWKTRDLTLRSNLFFERLLETQLRFWDPGLKISNQPGISTLIDGFDADERNDFLDKYYLLNSDNTNLGSNEQQQLLLEALTYFEAKKNRIPTDDIEQLTYNYEYVRYYSNELTKIFASESKFNKAVIYARTHVEATKGLLTLDKRNTGLKDKYLYSIKRHGVMMAARNPEKLAPIYQMLEEAEDLVKDKNNIYSIILRGNLAMLENNEELAYDHYAQAFQKSQNNSGLVKHIIDQVSSDVQLLNIRGHLQNDLIRVLEDYELFIYQYAELRRQVQEKKQSHFLEGINLLIILENTYNSCLEIKEISEPLAEHEFITQEKQNDLNQSTSDIGSELAWTYVQNGDWDLALQIAISADQVLPEANWPTAIYAIYAALDGDWIQAKKLLTQCRNEENDGYNTDTFSTIKQLLSIPNLPESIINHPNFSSNTQSWQESLN